MSESARSASHGIAALGRRYAINLPVPPATIYQPQGHSPFLYRRKSFSQKLSVKPLNARFSAQYSRSEKAMSAISLAVSFKSASGSAFLNISSKRSRTCFLNRQPENAWRTCVWRVCRSSRPYHSLVQIQSAIEFCLRSNHPISLLALRARFRSLVMSSSGVSSSPPTANKRLSPESTSITSWTSSFGTSCCNVPPAPTGLVRGRLICSNTIAIRFFWHWSGQPPG